MKQKDYYEILGIPEGAGEDEIKKKFRKLAKQFHPDKNPGNSTAEAKFKEVSEAYEVLGDKDKRHKYDELRKYGAGGAPDSMSYEDFMNRFGGQRADAGRQDDNTWGFGGSLDDIFSSLFGGRAVHSARGAHTQQRTSSPFNFASAPSAGSESGEPRATADAFFKRKGLHAYADIPVNLAQALLGSTVRVRTPQGKRVNMKIPAGTQPEAVFRLKGQGYQSSARTGDLFVRTHLALPSKLTAEQTQAVQVLAEKLNLKY